MDFNNLANMAKNLLDKDDNGFDLGDIQKLNLENLDLSKILTQDFLKQFTNFSSVQDLQKTFGIAELSDLSKMDISKLDILIKQNSKFENLQELALKATQFLSKN